MIRIILELMANPGSEKGAEPWLTRLFAHKAVGGYLFILVLPLALWLSASSGMAAIGACLIYALIELAEWVMSPDRRSRSLLWDCILDWSGVAMMAGMCWSIWEHELYRAVGFAVAGIAISVAGVWRRAK